MNRIFIPYFKEYGSIDKYQDFLLILVFLQEYGYEEVARHIAKIYSSVVGTRRGAGNFKKYGRNIDSSFRWVNTPVPNEENLFEESEFRDLGAFRHDFWQDLHRKVGDPWRHYR